MAFLFFLSSCALFNGGPSLQSMEKEKLLGLVKVTGEGRGRLTLGESQYLFGVDSVLNENHDWVMAVQIPLHGEEVMILPNLRKSEMVNEETESFEERIDKEFRGLSLSKKISSQKLIYEVRTLIRFLLSPQWGQKRTCVAQQESMSCELDGEKFLLSTTDKEFTIKKILGTDLELQLVAKNLTKSFFSQTDIKLHSERSGSSVRKNASFSLEFFW